MKAEASTGGPRAVHQRETSFPARPGTLSAVVGLAHEAVRRNPSDPQCWMRWGEALIMASRVNEAVSAMQDGLARHPMDRDLTMVMAEALLQSGEVERSSDLLQGYLNRKPGDLPARLLSVELLLRAGRLGGAARAAQYLQAEHAHQLRTAGQFDTGSRYRLALALAASGRETDSATLIPIASAVSIAELPCPAQFAGSSEFRRELRRDILANETLTADPPGKATRRSMQTLDLMDQPTPAIATLVEAISARAQLYERDFKALLGTAPRIAQTKAWAVVYGKTGLQESHIHPQGRISGVYYVGPETGQAGALLLGALPESFGFVPPWGVLRIDPVPGRLVFFPSWLPHATEQAGCDQQRISVSFDVVPLQ